MRTRVVVVAVVAAAALSGMLVAQTAPPPLPESPPMPGGVPFVIPPEGPATDSAVDQSKLNGPLDRVVRDGSVFRLSTSRERIRFFGLDVCGPELLVASKPQIDAMCRRLAAMGVNVVRLHHLDNMWARGGGGSLWRNADQLELDPDKVDLLLYAIAQFGKNGIYVNLNLKVSRELKPADGLPAKVDGHLFPLQKRVDRFFPPFLDQHRQFARAILTAKNPYTGKTLVDDPAVAFVEINNENTILSLWPGQPLGVGLDKLPQVYQDDLAVRWRAWLTQRYGDDQKLLTAWRVGHEPLGNSLFHADDPAALTPHSGAVAAMKPLPAPKADDALPPVRVEVTKSTGTNWHVQYTRAGLDLAAGKVYTLTFDVRSDAPTEFAVSADRDREDWRNVGLSGTVKATPQWTPQRFTFTAVDTQPSHSRITFQLGNIKSPVELRGLRLMPGTPEPVVPDGQSLAAKNLHLPKLVTDRQRRDWIEFLMGLDKAYADAMRSFLRNDLGVKAMICDTQVQWAGMGGYQREAGSDYIDSHGYWQHPQFHGRDWDPKNWSVTCKSQVAEVAAGKGGELVTLAQHRLADKPFAVSEYDHPAPNDFAVEMIPMFASFACVQDWDALYGFCHGPIRERTDQISGFFDQTGNPAKFAFYPSMARIFRLRLIPPAPLRSIALGERPWEKSPYAPGFWAAANLRELPSPTSYRVALTEGDPKWETYGIDGRYQTAISAGQGDRGPVWSAYSDQAAVIAGHIVGEGIGRNGFGMRVTELAGDFGAVTLVTLDGKPIRTSKHMLLTVAGRAENIDMGWNADRTSVGDRWGRGPVHIAAAKGLVTMPLHGRRMFALSPDGRRIAEVPWHYVDDSQSGFDIDPKYGTVWYEIAE
jgi:hypothetical protein